MKESSLKFKEKKRESGKKQLVCWIGKRTIREITKLKELYNCRNQGEVIDTLIMKQKEYSKIINDDKTTWQKKIEKRLHTIENKIEKKLSIIDNRDKKTTEKLSDITNDIGWLKAKEGKAKFDKLTNR